VEPAGPSFFLSAFGFLGSRPLRFCPFAKAALPGPTSSEASMIGAGPVGRQWRHQRRPAQSGIGGRRRASHPGGKAFLTSSTCSGVSGLMLRPWSSR
jgi:hypothetical protein